MLEELHKRFGKSDWNSLFNDAIKLAETGFEISPRLAKMIAADKGKLDRYEPAKTYFYGDSPTLLNTNYATSLKGLKDEGADYIYSTIAPEIITTIQDAYGLLSAEDLASYEIKQRDTVCGDYRGYKICSMGQPSSGALTILQTLKMLERFDLAELGADNPQSIHLIAEASRLAFADRNFYMADPDFVNTPDTTLLDNDYIEQRSTLINPDHKNKNIHRGIPTGWQERRAADPNHSRPGTSHISIIDQYGNMLSMTTTIEGAFGSRLMVGGFLLNNELTDFSFIAEKWGKPIANRVEAGKRPRSSMSPTIIFDPDGEPFLIIGSAGGSRIIGYVLQRIIATIDWDMGIQEALDMPHFLARGDKVELEYGLEHMQEPLEKLGHKISIGEMSSGLTAISIKGSKLTGAADPRREGTAKGE